MTDQQPPARAASGESGGRLTVHGMPPARQRPRRLDRPPCAPAHIAHRRRGGPRLLVSIAALAVVGLVTVLLLRPADSGPADRRGRVHPPPRARRRSSSGGPRPNCRPTRPVLVPDDLLDELSATDDRFRSLDADAPDALLLVTGQPPAGSLVLARFADPDGAALTVVDPAPGRAHGGRTRPAPAPVRGDPGQPEHRRHGTGRRGARGGDRGRAAARAARRPRGAARRRGGRLPAGPRGADGRSARPARAARPRRRRTRRAR